jgi:hypothetical protein
LRSLRCSSRPSRSRSDIVRPYRVVKRVADGSLTRSVLAGTKIRSVRPHRLFSKAPLPLGVVSRLYNGTHLTPPPRFWSRWCGWPCGRRAGCRCFRWCLSRYTTPPPVLALWPPLAGCWRCRTIQAAPPVLVSIHQRPPLCRPCPVFRAITLYQAAPPLCQSWRPCGRAFRPCPSLRPAVLGLPVSRAFRVRINIRTAAVSTYGRAAGVALASRPAVPFGWRCWCWCRCPCPCWCWCRCLIR